MRERSLFFKRTNVVNLKNPKRTYFLICEGICTEKIYFDALGDKLRSLEKDAIINLNIVEREETETSISNPKRIVDMVLSMVDEWKQNSKLQLPNLDEVCFASEIDVLCFVFDRDSKSFKDSQYDYVCKKCTSNGYKLCISNPCFEFWLLLHFGDKINLDKDKLLGNRKIGKRTYTETELCKAMPYKKNKYNAVKLMDKIQIAIKSEKNFCESVESLKNEVGSNVGLLVDELFNL